MTALAEHRPAEAIVETKDATGSYTTYVRTLGVGRVEQIVDSRVKRRSSQKRDRCTDIGVVDGVIRAIGCPEL
jgi:hypothetical protein